MARRPLLPERMTAGLAVMGGLVVWLGVTRGADALSLPEPVAIGLGIVVGILALVGIPTVLGRPSTGVLALAAVGGLALLVAFVNQVDDLGLGVGLAIYLPAAAVLVLVLRILWRFVVPEETRRSGL